MIVLGIDSASAGCAACVVEDGAVLAQKSEAMERGQDARLIPLVQEVLAQAGKSYDALDRIAVTRGPGSFTGIRIGLAAARGIGLAAEKPVFGLDRFRLLRAHHGAQADRLMIVLESRRLELYVMRPDGAAPEMLPPAAVQDLLREHPEWVVAGDGAGHLAGLLPSERILAPQEPEAVTAARLTLFVPEEQADGYAPLPLYVREPDVTIKACQEACA